MAAITISVRTSSAIHALTGVDVPARGAAYYLRGAGGRVLDSPIRARYICRRFEW